MTKTILFALVFFIMASPAGASDGNQGKIALVMKALTNPFFLKMKTGAEEYAKKHNIHLTTQGVEMETEIDRQIGIVESLISMDYQAIVIAPADSVKLVPVCKKAMDKGIKVINIDNPFHKETLDENKIKIPFVGSDNRKGASMVAEYIKRKMNGKGRAIILEGIRGVENADLRKQGFLDALGGQIEILASETANWHKDEAFTVMSGLLEKYKNVDAVLCANDNMALGAIQALDLSGLSGRVLIGSYDNIDEARNEMRNKNMHGTIDQHPELMGQYGVELATRALAGESIPDYTPTPLDLVTFEGFDKKIGLAISTLENPFFTDLQKGARNASELFGIELLTSDAHNDDGEQLVGIQQFIDSKVNAIIVNPTNTNAVSAAIDIAVDAGIDVFTVDRKSSKPNVVISHIASDNVAGGRMAGEFIAGKIGGKGTILEVEGIPGTSAAHDRGKGFNEVIGLYPNIKIAERGIADFDRSKAKKLVRRILKTDNSFDAVFAHNDMMAIGVIEAFEAAGIRLPRIIVGYDATPEALAAIKKGRLTATIAQKPETMGWIGIQSAVRHFRGEKLDKDILVGLDLVSAD